jgi:hypothetical protein
VPAEQAFDVRARALEELAELRRRLEAHTEPRGLSTSGRAAGTGA